MLYEFLSFSLSRSLVSFSTYTSQSSFAYSLSLLPATMRKEASAFRRDEHTPSPCHALGANRQQVLRFFRPLQASEAFCRYLSTRCVCSFPKYRLSAELPHNLSTLPKQTSHKASRPPLPAHTVRGNMRFLAKDSRRCSAKLSFEYIS